jgi:GrpB-like predicted nucleotidyltransferase (UPF0157 family)
LPRRPAESHEEKIARVIAERAELVSYDPDWPRLFEKERAHLLTLLPEGARIEHFGSTAVPGLAAKPVVDLLVEVPDLEAAKRDLAPKLEDEGYDYFWRPTYGDDGPPWYAWFIKRDADGRRTHHIHVIGPGPEFDGHRDRLLFRDYLRSHPEVARDYGALKLRLVEKSGGNRIKYTRLKGEFIRRMTELAKLENAARNG